MMLAPIGIYCEHCGEHFPSIFAGAGLIVGQDERVKIQQYLATAPIAIASTGVVKSVFDETQVSGTSSMRTDGKWVWHDSFAYYVGEGKLGLDKNFLAHIRKMNYCPPREFNLDLATLEFPW